MKHLLLLFLLIVSGILSAGYEYLRDPRTGKKVRFGGSVMPTPYVAVPVNPVFRRNEFRGVWVSTVGNIDFPKSPSAADFKRNYIRLVDELKSIGCNAVLFQVRPMCDAFYASRLNSWSAFMTGVSGFGYRGFDPMFFMIDEAHRRGMEFHAWLNPYRLARNVLIGKNAFLSSLPAGHFAKRNPDAVLMIPASPKGFNMILDPGNPKTVDFFAATVREIVQKYRVDAIHIDDYFYPYEPIGSLDCNSYRRYNPGKLPLAQWRRNNVDTMIRRVSCEIRAENRRSRRNVRFGVSPFGIWANAGTSQYGSPTKGHESVTGLYANSFLWVRNGWIDYVVPQLYWTFGHDKAAYAAIACWWNWAVSGTRVQLYTGNTVARIGTNSEWSNPMEVYNQLRYNTLLSNVRGSVMFSASRLLHPENSKMKQGAGAVIHAWRKAAGR